MGRKILVVDDEKNIVDIIAFNLHKEGYDAICAHDGEKGLELALSDNPDLILLDVMMPKIDGFEVCRRIREKSQTPIIMLTARASELDTVLGLELGADDYIQKPFKLRELMARIKANLRRLDKLAEDNGNVLKFDDVEIYPEKFEVRKNGEPIKLTHKEYELLKFLASNNTRAFTREELLEHVWGYDDHFGDTRNVDVTVKRLRSKVETNPEKPEYVLTKRNVGYYFGK